MRLPTTTAVCLLFATLAVGSAVFQRDARSLSAAAARPFVKRRESPLATLPDDFTSKLTRSESFTYPTDRLGIRKKRLEDSGGKCGLSESAMLETDAVALSETAEAIQAIWVDSDRILIIASDAARKTTTVWLGVPRSIGIFVFSPHPNLIKESVAPASLQVANSNRRRAVVVSSDKRHLYVSSDGGRNWGRVSLPSPYFDETSDIYLSQVNPDHMLLVAKAGGRISQLFHSSSVGEKWSTVSSNAQLVRYAQSSSGREFVFYLTPGRHQGINTLHRMDIVAAETEILDRRSYRFAIDGRYLFVSRQNYSGDAESDDHSRLLYVCSDFEKKAEKTVFSEVHLPSLTPEQFYVIMASHEAGAFIHVSVDSHKLSGGLYTSDSSGTRFSLSLPNHFYKVYHIEAINWHYSVDDFYEVASMRGVFITTAIVGGASDDVSHVTMITFNNGGEWQRLRPPTSHAHSCRYPSCSLHLLLHYSRMTAHHYNHTYSSSLFSVKSAVGIIIGHGTIGKARDDAKPRLVLSNDGGYSWNDPGFPEGSYVYGIADYGNIIAVAMDTEHVEYIWFSHDRGKCFVKQLLDTTQAFSLSRGLLMDPQAASLTAFVMGVEGEGSNDEWRMITLNFKRLLQRVCLASDYFDWSEHRDSDTCLLGYKDTYNITQSSSICYNELAYKPKPVRRVRCACTYEDLECDYGYNRADSTSCTKMKGYDLSKLCPPGVQHYNTTKSGFRLIPGDQCQPTDTSRRELSWQQLACASHEEESGFDNTHRRKYYSSPGRIVGGIIIALVIVAVASVAFYGFIRCREKGPDTYERVLYQKLPTSGKLSATEDESSDEDLINPSPASPENPFQGT